MPERKNSFSRSICRVPSLVMNKCNALLSNLFPKDQHAKMTPEQLEQARAKTVAEARTFVANLASVGLISIRQKEKFERHIAREERRHRRAQRERLEAERGPLPTYSKDVKPGEQQLLRQSVNSAPSPAPAVSAS